MSETDLANLMERLRLAAERQQDAKPGPDLKAVLNELAAMPRELSDEITGQVMGLLPHIRSAPGAGLLCVWLGAGVEGGRPAAQSAPAVFEAFMTWAATIPDDEADAGMDGTPEIAIDEQSLIGVDLLGSAVVTHLVCLQETEWLKIDLESLSAAAERITHVSNGATWVVRALSQQSGHLVVLIVDEKKGFRLSYRNISNCFHLFTLLQAALVPEKSRRANRQSEAIAAATGKSKASGTDQAWWHYAQPFSPEPNLAASIWGEGRPSQIAKLDGEQVLLAWPRLLGSRTWDFGFFTPFLEAAPPEVKLVSPLSREEVEDYWIRLKLPKPRPWWKFW